MKGELIKKLHAMGVYRDPKTKQKLESMKLAAVLEVLRMVEEEMEHGTVYERKQCDYEFVKPLTKAEKSAKGKVKRR